MENLSHPQVRNDYSWKRKSEEMVSTPVSKKRNVNFHSIADLIQSDAVEHRDTSPELSQQLPPQIARELPSATINPTGPDVTPTRPSNTPESHTFPPIDHYSTLSVGVERPPSLTPPASPESAVGTKCSKRKRESGPDPKKGRTIYTSKQLYLLEAIFSRTQYPDGNTMGQLARDLGVTETKIKVWFQNKRARFRRKLTDPSSTGYANQTHAHSPSTPTTTPPQLIPITAQRPVMSATPGQYLPSSGWMPPNSPMMPFSPQMEFQNGPVPSFPPVNGFSVPVDKTFTFGSKGHFQGTPMGGFHNPLPSPVSPNDSRLSISTIQTGIPECHNGNSRSRILFRPQTYE